MSFEVSKTQRHSSQTTLLNTKDLRMSSVIMQGFDYIRIIFFESVGTMLFAYGICCSQNMPPNYPTPSDYTPIANPGHSLFVSFSLFLAICWCGQFTGGHCNPAVTTVFVMKPDGDLTLAVGFVYMGSQLLGAFLGSMLAWGLVGNIAPPMIEGASVGQCFIDFLGQAFGTLLFTLFILIVTCKETTFIQNTLSVYASIVTALYIARTFSFRTEGLNPALGLGMEIAYGFYKGKWKTFFAESWVVIFGPFLGAIVASIFFEHFYRPLLRSWKAKS